MINPDKRRAYTGRDTNEAVKMFNANHFVLVADMPAMSLDDMYTKTQNWDKNWQENEDVLVWDNRKEFKRSSMIGDIFKTYGENSLESGYYIVSSFGFEKLIGIDV